MSSQNQYFSEHQMRFAMVRVKAIRKRVKKSFELKGSVVDLPNDKLVLRIQAGMWLEAKEQSSIEKADQWTEACAWMEAVFILDNVYG
ncbi:MAG: hypothetical protein V4629_07065 [Pseudomonadota bacterium]